MDGAQPLMMAASKGTESVLAAATTLEKRPPFKMACNWQIKDALQVAWQGENWQMFQMIKEI